MTLQVDPEALKQAAAGITGVIDGLSTAPVSGSYAAQMGRGFDDLKLTGRQMSAADAKSSMDDFCDRWEWGMRSLIQTANDIAKKLDIGAGMYAEQEKFAANSLKDAANDLAGDPSLQQKSVTLADGTVVKGTDDMSAGELFDHNSDMLTHPDVSAESVNEATESMKASASSALSDLPAAAENGALGAVPGIGPGLVAGKTVAGEVADHR